MTKSGNCRCFLFQDLLNRCFRFWVIVFFVSSLFLLHIPTRKLYCISVTYNRFEGFEEEDHDGGIAHVTF